MDFGPPVRLTGNKIKITMRFLNANEDNAFIIREQDALQRVGTKPISGFDGAVGMLP